MAKRIQFRRGTTSATGSFTGAVGEVTVDTDKEVVVVHDGSTAGGFPMVRNGGSENVGVGTSTPDGKLHVHTGTAGSLTAAANSDDLVVENSADGGISILTPAGNAGQLTFGSTDSNVNGSIAYDHGTDSLRFSTAASEKVRIETDGDVAIGTTTATGKLTVEENAAPATSGTMSTGFVIQASGTSYALNMGCDTANTHNWINSSVANAANTAAELKILIGGVEKVKITTDGNVVLSSVPASADGDGLATGTVYHTSGDLKIKT
tara:strand:+ start:188 stop:979 length:792 start_codon:yes stop_codon:yes gene_type:complete